MHAYTKTLSRLEDHFRHLLIHHNHNHYVISLGHPTLTLEPKRTRDYSERDESSSKEPQLTTEKKTEESNKFDS